MSTLTREEERYVKGDNLESQYQDDPLCLAWSGLKVLDMTYVKEAYGHLKTIDISGNLLVSLPKSFCRTLRHCEYLDLSRNQLEFLPKNFGLLINLHTLILYLNKLETLPVSFRKLKNLRWLDVAANPLEPRLVKICGEDLSRCEVVARNVIEFMHDLYNAKESDVRTPDPNFIQSKITQPHLQRPQYEERVLPSLSQSENEEFTFTPNLSEGDSVTEDETRNNMINHRRYSEQLRNNTSKSTVRTKTVHIEEKAVFQYDELIRRSTIILLKVFCGVLISVGLFALICFSLAYYYQGPPEALLNGGRLRKYEKVSRLTLHSWSWAVYLCPTCIPYRNQWISSLVAPRKTFLMNLLSLFFSF